MKVEDLKHLQKRLTMTRQPAPRSHESPTMAQSVNLTTGTTVFALQVVHEVWEREEEDRGDILEFGGRVAGQVVRLV